MTGGTKFSFYTPSFSVGNPVGVYEEEVEVLAPTPTHSEVAAPTPTHSNVQYDASKPKIIDDAAAAAILEVVDEAEVCEEFHAEVVKPTKSADSDATEETMDLTLANTLASSSIDSTEVDVGLALANTIASASVDSAEMVPKTMGQAAASQLEAMVALRLRAIDDIRSLLGQELEHDNGLLAEFTAQVTELQQTVASKNDAIEELHEEIAEIEAKNAAEVRQLSEAIDELMEANVNSVALTEAMEKKLVAKTEALEEMAALSSTTEVAFTKSAEENEEAAALLLGFRSEMIALQQTIAEMVEEATKQKAEHEAVVAELKKTLDETALEMMEQMDAEKKVHEEHVQGLVTAHEEEAGSLTKTLEDAKASCMNQATTINALRKEAEGAKAAAAEKHDELIDTIALLENGLQAEMAGNQRLRKGLESAKSKYQEECEKNAQVVNTNEEHKAQLAQMAEEHTVAMAGWEKRLQEETDANTCLAEEMITLTDSLDGVMKEREQAKLDDEAAAETHASKVEMMEKEHEVAVAKMVETHKANAAESAEEHKAATAQMKEQHEAAISGLEERLKAEQQSTSQLKQESTELRTDLEDAQGATSQIADLLAASEAQLEATKQANAKEKALMTTELDEAASMLTSNEVKLRQLQGELVEVRQHQRDETAALEERLADAERQLAAAATQKEEADRRLGDMKGEVAEAKGKQKELLGRFAALLESLDDMDDITANVSMEKQELVQLVAEAQAFKSDVQSDVEEIRRFVILSNFRDKTRWTSGV